MALLNCLAAFLHDSHAHLHQQRHNYNQRRNDETVNHGADASLLHAGEGGIQSGGSQCADHQELAGSLGAAHRRTCPDAKGLIRHTQCPAHDGKQHDHRHVK